MPRAERPLAVLVTGDPIARVEALHGSWATLIRRAAGEAFPGAWSVVDLRGGAGFPEPSTLAGAVITGSASSVTERAPWMLSAEAYLRNLVAEGVPVFGICFGHQLLGQALGGLVEQNPLGREIGTVDLAVIAEDELLRGAPPIGQVNTTHRDTVTRLPGGARVLGRTALEPHAVVRFGVSAWGVQFHPEIDREVMRAYLEERRELIRGEGGDPEGLIARVGEGESGRALLRRFCALIPQR